MVKLPFKKNSLLYAPMEGVTDAPYRIAVSRVFSEWDYFSTDFFRVPTVGNLHEKAIIRHYGTRALEKESLKNKTSYQILTSAKAQTTTAVKLINNLGFHHLDLNLGCPSKKVNAHQGGAYLLNDLTILKKVISDIRVEFSGLFTAKIRIGYHDDKLFEELLRMLEGEGVDAITLHARTRDQLYQGIADWSYIKRAVEVCSIPIIGNGDIWTVEDIIRINEECNPYALMLGRGAMKTPWLADLYHQYKDNPDFLSEEFLISERKKGLDIYFYELEREYKKEDMPDESILKRFKSFSRNMFDDFENFESVRAQFLRSSSLSEFKERLDSLVNT